MCTLSHAPAHVHIHTCTHTLFLTLFLSSLVTAESVVVILMPSTPVRACGVCVCVCVRECVCSCCYAGWMGLALDFVHPFQAMRQWWEMKAKHFDTVLFFKVSTPTEYGVVSLLL